MVIIICNDNHTTIAINLETTIKTITKGQLLIIGVIPLETTIWGISITELLTLHNKISDNSLNRNLFLIFSVSQETILSILVKKGSVFLTELREIQKFTPYNWKAVFSLRTTGTMLFEFLILTNKKWILQTHFFSNTF